MLKSVLTAVVFLVGFLLTAGSASAADISKIAGVTDVKRNSLQVRFSEKVCRSWRKQARDGNDVARKLWREVCKGDDNERRGHWRRKCREWRKFRDDKGHHHHRRYREHCRGRKYD